MATTGQKDTFARDNLPPRSLWPEFKFDLPGLQYPERLNCVTELLDKWVAAGEGARPCLISHTEQLTYAQLAAEWFRLAMPNANGKPRQAEAQNDLRPVAERAFRAGALSDVKLSWKTFGRAVTGRG